MPSSCLFIILKPHFHVPAALTLHRSSHRCDKPTDLMNSERVVIHNQKVIVDHVRQRPREIVQR